jgi:hypothetical protein
MRILRPGRLRWPALFAAGGSLLVAAGLAAAPVSAASTAKAPIVGLVDMGSQAAYVLGQPFGTVDTANVARSAAAFGGIVVNVTWAQLAPSPDRRSFTALDRSLAAVRSYNRTHSAHPLAVRLRVFGGFAAPAWAKALDGPPVTLPAKGRPTGSGTVGRWWTPAYRAAWSSLQHALASTYDGDPLLRSVAVSSCASLSAEPFVMPNGKAGLGALLAAGWTSSAQQRCLTGAFADYDGWKLTPIDYTFNPFTAVTPGARVGHADLDVTYGAMSTCAHLHARTGRACELDNHGLSSGSATTTRSTPVYAEINTLYRELKGKVAVSLQTISPGDFGGCAAIRVAVAHHANAVELWPPRTAFKGYAAFSGSTLTAWSRALATGRGPSC